jgi:hypothetical protein
VPDFTGEGTITDQRAESPLKVLRKTLRISFAVTDVCATDTNGKGYRRNFHAFRQAA